MRIYEDDLDNNIRYYLDKFCKEKNLLSKDKECLISLLLETMQKSKDFWESLHFQEYEDKLDEKYEEGYNDGVKSLENKFSILQEYIENGEAILIDDHKKELKESYRKGYENGWNRGSEWLDPEENIDKYLYLESNT